MSIEIKGYDVLEPVFESNLVSVYRAVREQDGEAVIIKTLSAEFPSNRDVARMRREYQIAEKLQDIAGVIDVYGLETYGNGNLAIVMQPFGVSLGKFLQDRNGTPLEVGIFLKIAINIARTLSAVHQHNIVHKDIVPRNILLDESSAEIRLVDFGISSELSRERQDINVSRRLQGSLAYISPEQTGRMNRDLDYRSDYYSMGISFYQMLTGKLPFHGDNVLEWVHCHISKAPVPPVQLNADIPEPLSAIVLKLISKNAEERYQSSYGLAADLDKCQQQYEQTGDIAAFPLGQSDISENFQIPQRLYGREQELSVIMSIFEQVARGGCEMCLVSGYSGVGKSALVNEINKPIVHAKGYFIQGKFDQFQRNTPYSAISHAFRNLATQLLAEPKDRLEIWKQAALETLAPNAQLMIDLVPELENIIGPQTAVQELPPTEAQNRLQIVFINFVKLIAGSEHPLVVFLDDLQWSDAPTLSLIQKLMTSRDISHLFLIGAYRSNEVKTGHPLLLSLDEIGTERKIRDLPLKPLELSSVNDIVADTLHWSEQESEPLAELLYQKTEGNPFFINELLKAFHESDAITFNAEAGKWELDLEAAEAAEVSGSVVEFMVGNLKKLPDAAQQTLQLAACIGNTFDLNTLAIIYESSMEDTSASLSEPLKRSMIIPLDEGYKFVHGNTAESGGSTNKEYLEVNPVYRFQHDRVQQAAYALIDQDKKQAVHLSIGRLIQKHTDSDQLEERLLDIVRHLNEGRKLISNEGEKEQLARMNLRAGIKAKNASAYQAALQYLETGIGLLHDDCWESQYNLTLQLGTELTQCAYLTGRYDDAEAEINSLLEHVKTPLEKAEVLSMRTRQYATMGKMQESIQAAIEGLNLLGLEFTDNPDDSAIATEKELVEVNLGDRTIADLINAPRVEDPRKLVAIRLLMEIFPAAFLSGSGKLFPFLVLKSVNLSLKHGNSPESAFAYAGYGMLLCGMLDRPGEGYQYGKLALEMNESFQDIPLKSRLIYVYTMFIHHWNNHWSTMTPWFKRGIESGYQSGDLLYLAYSAQDCIIWDPKLDLETTCEEQTKYLAIVRDCEYRDSLDSGTLYLQMCLNFRGLTVDRYSMDDENFNESQCLEGMRQRKFMTGIANYHIYKTEIHCLYGDHDGALEHVREQDRMIQSSMSLPQLVRYYLVAFLTLTAKYPELEEQEQLQTLERLQGDLARMAGWADNCPDNFLHIQRIMEAELARLAGDIHGAVTGYTQAIKAAGKYEFIRDEALANELLAKFFIQLDMEKAAAGYMSAARYIYYRWGARRKVEQLEADHARLLRLGIDAGDDGPATMMQADSTSLDVGEPGSLDLISVMKASRTISSEIVLDQLWTRIIRILLENAGAQSAYFVLKHDDQLYIEAKGVFESDEFAVSQNIPVEVDGEDPKLPVAVINYALRSQSYVVLDNASDSSQFSNDPYIVKHQPQSVICVPILRFGQYNGAIYMENNLTTGAFTADRVEVMELLSAQAAISIENAQLYDNLETKVQERTQELSDTLDDLKKAQSQLVQSEKMAGLGSLVSGVAHEINNPTNFVSIGAVSLNKDLTKFKELLFEMLGDENDPEIIEHFNQQFTRLFTALDNINEGASRISTIVQDLRTFSRLDEAEKKTVPLVENLESTLRLVRAQYDKGIDFICEFTDNPEIECFPAQLNQVFMNLMVNACQSIHKNYRDSLPEGESTQRSFALSKDITIGSLTIRTNVRDHEVRIDFADSGAGMTKEVKQKIFEPFYTTKEVGEGTGMGMSISYQIIEKHGGRFSIESEQGEGATITVILPLT